jgi:hypothetical protein
MINQYLFGFEDVRKTVKFKDAPGFRKSLEVM